jgi:predicted nucleotidyltransferase component of viral defense system
MIPYDTITAWGVLHPWPTREQIEQDMLLSRAICDIYANERLAGELVLRGGTALNKLILAKPYRYSEDLDFVRTTSGGIGEIMRELTELGKMAAFQVKTRIGQFPKVYWLGKAQTGIDLRIKIELNTNERSPVLPLTSVRHVIQSDWYSGEADARVFQFEEIAATKLRALYQRSKGRDLFDLWLLATEIRVDSNLVLDVFSAYRPQGYTSKKAIENLEAKLRNPGFMSDIAFLISGDISGYRPGEAADMIIREYLAYV